MKLRSVFLLCSVFFCTTLSWGQTWDLSSTMTATLSGGVLTISTAASSEAMPNYSGTNVYAPWYSMRSSIRSVVIEEKVTSIGNTAFYNCLNLASVTIPNSVTTIGSSAFWYCERLTAITIPKAVTFIDEAAFGGCTGLKNVTVGWDVPYKPPSGGQILFAIFFNVDLSAITLHVPAGTKALYAAAAPWWGFGTIVEETTGWPEGIHELNTEIGAHWLGDRLYVYSPVVETIQIYSTQSIQLYSFTKPTGTAEYPVNYSNGTILIVTGSSGWVRKVIKQ